MQKVHYHLKDFNYYMKYNNKIPIQNLHYNK